MFGDGQRLGIVRVLCIYKILFVLANKIRCCALSHQMLMLAREGFGIPSSNPGSGLSFNFDLSLKIFVFTISLTKVSF